MVRLNVVRKGGLGVETPLELDTKTLLPAQREYLFSHTLCLFICRFNGNTLNECAETL